MNMTADKTEMVRLGVSRDLVRKVSELETLPQHFHCVAKGMYSAEHRAKTGLYENIMVDGLTFSASIPEGMGIIEMYDAVMEAWKEQVASQ